MNEVAKWPDRKTQRERSKAAKRNRKYQDLKDRGPVGFFNLYGKADPTPYHADRLIHAKSLKG